MKSDYDVIVIGAGPAGSIAARTTAQAGLATLLLEKRQEIGSPVRCGEAVGLRRSSSSFNLISDGSRPRSMRSACPIRRAIV